MSTRETVSRSASTAHEEQAGRSTGRPGGPDAHLLALQRGAGNQFVQRMLRASPPPPPPPRGRRAPPITRGRAVPAIQRYRVRVPASADYDTVVGWLASSNPHRPQAALTRARFRWRGTPNVEAGEGDSEGEYTVTFPAATVSLRKTVDMPEWRSSSAPMREVWEAMYAQLRAHEAEHEAIADRWKTTLQDRVREFSTTVYGGTVRAAGRQGVTDLNSDWGPWLDEHQADQSAIDPYTATLERPAEEEGD